MTTRSRRLSRPRSRGRREKTTWENVNFEILRTAAAGVSVADITPVFIQTNAFQTPSKIIRSLMSFDFDVDSSIGEVQSISVGILVVNHESLTGDGIPDVINDFQQDFYFWKTFSLRPVSNEGLHQHFEVDIRTSRRLRGGYGLLFIAQNPVQERATTLDVSMRNLWVLS